MYSSSSSNPSETKGTLGTLHTVPNENSVWFAKKPTGSAPAPLQLLRQFVDEGLTELTDAKFTLLVNLMLERPADFPEGPHAILRTMGYCHPRLSNGGAKTYAALWDKFAHAEMHKPMARVAPVAPETVRALWMSPAPAVKPQEPPAAPRKRAFTAVGPSQSLADSLSEAHAMMAKFEQEAKRAKVRVNKGEDGLTVSFVLSAREEETE